MASSRLILVKNLGGANPTEPFSRAMCYFIILQMFSVYVVPAQVPIKLHVPTVNDDKRIHSHDFFQRMSNTFLKIPAIPNNPVLQTASVPTLVAIFPKLLFTFLVTDPCLYNNWQDINLLNFVSPTH